MRGSDDGGDTRSDHLDRATGGLAERLADLEFQVRALVASQTLEARDLVVKDERGGVRARLEMQEYAPRLTFYDRLGTERLWTGLRTDGMPVMGVAGREIPLGEE